MLYLVLYFPFILTALLVALWIWIDVRKKHPKDIETPLAFVIFAFMPIVNIGVTLIALFVIGSAAVDLAKRILP